MKLSKMNYYYEVKGIGNRRKTIENIAKNALNATMIVPSSDNNESKYKVKLFPHHPLVSEIGTKLATDYYPQIDFAVAWRYDPLIDEFRLNARACPQSNIDLSFVMKKFPNGGGHPKVGACTIPSGSTFRTFFENVHKS